MSVGGHHGEDYSLAVARPIPDAAPVTKPTLPTKSLSSSEDCRLLPVVMVRVEILLANSTER
jgi:hypothetical protein